MGKFFLSIQSKGNCAIKKLCKEMQAGGAKREFLRNGCDMGDLNFGRLSRNKENKKLSPRMYLFPILSNKSNIQKNACFSKEKIFTDKYIFISFIKEAGVSFTF